MRAFSWYLMVGVIAVTGLGLEPAYAQDVQRGRLPDGRAFRTDAQGFQLVDYTAELEQTIEELKQQIRSLDNELEHRDRNLERFRTGKTVDNSLGERDLVSIGQAPTPEFELDDRADCEPRLSRLEEELVLARKSISQSKQELQDLQLELKAAKAQRSRVTTALSGSAVEEQVTVPQADLADLQLKVKRLEEQLAASTSTQGKLETNLKIARARAAELEQAQKLYLTKLSEPNQRLLGEANQQEQEVAATRRAYNSSQHQAVTLDGANSASVSAVSNQTFASVKGSLKTNLNKLGGLIVERDKYFRQLTRLRRQAEFTPNRLVSRRGFPLQVVRLRIGKATTMQQLYELQGDIADINRKVDEDLIRLRQLVR